MAIVRVWTHPGTGERLINDEWLVNTETRKIAPAENGVIAHDSTLCLEDFREPGRTAVMATDEEGHEWLLNLETFQATPAIAGGDGVELVPPETCPIHRSAELRHSEVPLEESALLFGVRHISYCPLLECDYVTYYVGGLTKIRDRILLLFAVRQKALTRKLAEQFVGNGK